MSRGIVLSLGKVAPLLDVEDKSSIEGVQVEDEVERRDKVGPRKTLRVKLLI